jgi:hypothetical protein
MSRLKYIATAICGLLFVGVPTPKAEASVWNCRFNEMEQGLLSLDRSTEAVHGAYYICETYSRGNENNIVILRVRHLERVGGIHFFEVVGTSEGWERSTQLTLHDHNNVDITVDGYWTYWLEVGADFTRRIGHHTDYLRR